MSLVQSVLSVSQPSIPSGLTSIVKLQARDSVGNDHSTGGLTVAFSLQGGGTSDGTIGPVSDNNDGTYTVSFVGTTVGSARTIAATIGGNALASTLPTITVTIGRPTISAVSTNSGAPGSSITITGTNFNASPGQNVVFFGTMPAAVTSASPTSRTVALKFQNSPRTFFVSGWNFENPDVVCRDLREDV